MKFEIELTHLDKRLADCLLEKGIEFWAKKAFENKLNKCKKRLIKNDLPKLISEKSHDSLPSDEDKLIELLLDRLGDDKE